MTKYLQDSVMGADTPASTFFTKLSGWELETGGVPSWSVVTAALKLRRKVLFFVHFLYLLSYAESRRSGEVIAFL